MHPSTRFRRTCDALTVALIALVAFTASTARAKEVASKRPNVILVMTDDQGYGDLACHGNRVIKTPHLDKLYTQSVRLTQYHVDPTCAPTRSALLTGRYSSRTGVWHTIMGRSLMAKDEITIGDVFSKGGYRTAMFGKWHLGDSYPLFPENRGFDEVIRHGGGGVGQTPDYWGNDYFGDTYWHNGKPTKYDGYCTDVFFDGALSFIEKNREQPFFVYVATNAPHGPYLVADKYSQPYRDQGVQGSMAAFWGMITNIDENMGRLMAKLKQLDLERDTILIFTTDNGTAAGSGGRRGGTNATADHTKGFNAGMRGKKGSEYDGGHRVPLFIRWPAKFEGGRDVETITAHIDVLPTLTAMCKIELLKGMELDGKNLAPLIYGEKVAWPDRTLLVHSQRIEHPEKWRKSAVMTDRWRLVNGKELYDMQADPGQGKDVASEHSAVVEDLRGEYDKWYASFSPRFNDVVRIDLGAEGGNPTSFTCHDWHSNSVPWNQRAVGGSPKANGYWEVEVMRDGKYEFTLRARPEQVKYVLDAVEARLTIGDVAVRGQAIKKDATSATITVDLKAGKSRLKTWLVGPDGTERGAFFVDVKRVGE